MTEITALILANLNAYNYPACRIVTSTIEGELDFGGGKFGNFLPTKKITDIQLDNYHYELLAEHNAHMNLAGLASVIYWGYATFGDRYARNKVGWFLNGHRSVQAVSYENAKVHLRNARSALDRNEYGEAIGHIGKMGQLGRTPFASKVIAFMAPHGAGVYDNRIMNGISKSPTLRQAFAKALRGVGPVSSRSVQEKYAAWCAALQELATATNSIKPELRLRPVDVERAIFAAVARS